MVDNENKSARERVLADYPSVIKFSLEVDGSEPLPRSTNIAQIRWRGESQDFPLLVEFFGYTRKDGVSKPRAGYTYDDVPVEVWIDLVAGIQIPGDDRRSSGKVFHRLVKNGGFPYEKKY